MTQWSKTPCAFSSSKSESSSDKPKGSLSFSLSLCSLHSSSPGCVASRRAVELVIELLDEEGSLEELLEAVAVDGSLEELPGGCHGG